MKVSCHRVRFVFEEVYVFDDRKMHWVVYFCFNMDKFKFNQEVVISFCCPHTIVYRDLFFRQNINVSRKKSALLFLSFVLRFHFE